MEQNGENRQKGKRYDGEPQEDGDGDLATLHLEVPGPNRAGGRRHLGHRRGAQSARTGRGRV